MTIEEQVAEAMTNQGWNVLRNGWPDLLCYRKKEGGGTEILAVEVKDSRTGDSLRPAQIKNHMVLNAAGLKVVIVRSTEECTKEITGTAHSIEQHSQELLLKIKARIPQLEKATENFTKSIERRRNELLNDLNQIEERYKEKSERIMSQLREIEDNLAALSAGLTEKASNDSASYN